MSHFFQAPGGQNKSVMPRQASPTEVATGLLPGAKADAAARAGGGLSPEFLQNVLGGKIGANPADLDVLTQIRKSLNIDEPQGP